MSRQQRLASRPNDRRPPLPSRPPRSMSLYVMGLGGLCRPHISINQSVVCARGSVFVSVRRGDLM